MQSHTPLLHALTCLEMPKTQVELVESHLSQVTDWSGLLGEIELHGLAPLFYQHVSNAQLVVPAEQLMALRALNLRHGAAADARYKAYAQLDKAFAQENIVLVALKGLALAPMIYKQDKLRPMRDIDLLVAPQSLAHAERIMRECGYDLPAEQATRYMRDAHQLPNATKLVDGFNISVEIHHDAISRDITESLRFGDVRNELQSIQWRALTLTTLKHELMLHQLCRHLQGLHPGDRTKLINVLDIVAYTERFEQQIDWLRLQSEYSHVLNTLKCLHLITPLSEVLQSRIPGVSDVSLSGVGQPMASVRRILTSNKSWREKLNSMLCPSQWWLHLYYNVDPAKTLFWVKTFRHPLRLITWVLRRAYAGVFGARETQ